MEEIEDSRLVSQLRFLLEADRLKTVLRGNSIGEGSRRENSAEHSWHVVLMAIVLVEHCPHAVELSHVIELLVVHDLVEVFAGDTQIYDLEAVKSQFEREKVAAKKIFGLLPADQAVRLESLWMEFEERVTPEAKYAKAIDALAPTWLHWGDHATPSERTLSASQILSHKIDYLEGYPNLFDVLKDIVQSSLTRGLLLK